MKYTLLLLLLTISLKAFSQNENDFTGYTTICFLSDKDVIDIKGKVFKIEDDYFLKIKIDESLLDDSLFEYHDFGSVNLIIETENDDPYSFHSIPFLQSITFSKSGALFLIDKISANYLSSDNIKLIKIDFRQGTNYTFKNISNPDFLKNNIKRETND